MLPLTTSAPATESLRYLQGTGRNACALSSRRTDPRMPSSSTPSSSIIETLLRELLDQELRAHGTPLSLAGERRARTEIERFLRARAEGLAEGSDHGAWLGLPSAELEEALRRARAAATAPEEIVGEIAGEVLDGKYVLEELLAEGGFGKVYRARDRDLDCAVAIKLLKAVEHGSPAHLAAFKEEARRLTRLQHPNIVEWKTLNRSADGRLYLVMEFLEGETLEDTLRREGKLEPRRAARLLLGVLDALRHAHDLPDGSSLLHLDLKPSNVFLVRGRGAERVKVLDFGISRFVGQEERGARRADGDLASLGESTRLSGSGDSGTSIACTPHYCPPEQAARVLGGAAGALDGRADLYSLGVMAFRMLSGRLPFERGTNALEMLRQHREVAAPPLASIERGVPKALARFVDRCLCKLPAERFASAQEAHEILRRIVEPARSRLWLGAGLCAAGAWLWAALAPAGALPALEVVALDVRGLAEGERVADRTLHAGPASPALALELVDLAPGTELGAVSLVREPRRGAEAARGWELHPSGDRRLELRALPSGAHDELVFLALQDSAGTRFSAPFRLRYVAPADWTVESADVAGRAGRGVAPPGQELELVVHGARDVLPPAAEVRLVGEPTEPDERRSASRDEARSTAERSTYRLSLKELPLAPGRNALELCVVDLAANEQRRTLELEVFPSPLELESCALESGTLAGGRWHLLAGEEFVLVVRASRRARLAWTVEGPSGHELASGRSAEGAREHRVTIPSASWPGGALAGSIRVALDESEWVAHATGSSAGAAETRLAFELRATGAEFDVALNGARERSEAGRGEPDRVETVRYVAADTLELAVVRSHDVPMVVRARLEPEGGVQDGPTAELVFDAPPEQRMTAELRLPRDGLHRLVLEGRRLDPEGRPFERVDARRVLWVVRDTRAPRVAFAPGSEGRVLRTRDELARLALPLQVADEGWTADPAPVGVGWTLELTRANGPREDAAGSLALLPGAPFALVPALPAVDPATLPDGRYALRLTARDFAGNLAPAGDELTFVVSTEGPRLRVLAPAGAEPWARSEQRFTVELEADDANGVAAVACELADARGELAPLVVALTPAAVPGRWSGNFVLDHRWAGREVVLRLTGTDAAGTETRAPLEARCTVGPIPSLVPAHVEIAYRGRGAGSMRRVTGNGGIAYLFGGRGDALENASFRAAGLADFATSSIASSLAIEVPPGALEDFYLDEREVSVTQYLAFLRAVDGYSDTDLWDAPPVPERRAELERELAALEPELPVTGVDFDEARAFARWAGKELPTYLHWEYAVRGLAGRPYSFSGLAAPDAPGEVLAIEINSEVNVGTGGAWPVTRGADLTPDTLLADLCSNVAEWSETPVRGRLSEARPAELLARGTARAGERLYVTGGSFARAAFHFGVVAREPRSTRSASLGFRCFLPARVVEAAFLSTGGDHRVTSVR
jgi:serine/threonine protein kinase